ncbi:hypothetical protein [Epilithonimonas sp. UC225_85]|uniref:hypothetical protein n=1 Tax=Epilithonimonas sp. UC225_85 TaxID=3350167 RepID=UPI0036D3B83F
MKKLYTILFAATAYLAHAQIGINTSNPQVTLSIGDDNSGLERNQEDELSIVTANTNRLKILQNGNIGINKEAPAKILDINANNDFIKLNNLKTLTSSDPYYLVYDKANGDIYKTTIQPKAGQILRVPIVANNYVANSASSIQFNTGGSSIPAPSGLAAFPNYVNTISDDFISYPITIATNEINNIPPGTYKIILKLCGGFLTGNDTQRVDVGMTTSTGGAFVDYSYSEGIISNWSNTDATDKTGYYTDVIKFTAPSNSIRFKIDVKDSPFNMEFSYSDIHRNVLILERL